MGETYKVDKVTAGEPFDYTPPGSPTMTLVPYELELSGPDAPSAEVTLNQVPDTPAPTVGQELFGNLSQGSYGWRFKKENPNFPQGSFGNAGGGSNGQPGQFDRKPDHPTVEARAKHSTAVGATTGFIEQMLTIKVADQPQDWDSYWALVEQVMAKLEATYPSV